MSQYKVDHVDSEQIVTVSYEHHTRIKLSFYCRLCLLTLDIRDHIGQLLINSQNNKHKKKK